MRNTHSKGAIKSCVVGDVCCFHQLFWPCLNVPRLSGFRAFSKLKKAPRGEKMWEENLQTSSGICTLTVSLEFLNSG